MLNKDLIIRLIERRSMVVYDMSPRNIYCPLQSLSFDLVTISRKRRHKLIFLLRSLTLDIWQGNWFLTFICLLHFFLFAKITRSENTGASIQFIHPIYSRCLCARPIYRPHVTVCVCAYIQTNNIWPDCVTVCLVYNVKNSPISSFSVCCNVSIVSYCEVYH